MPLQLCPHSLQEHGYPVLPALALADGDFIALEVDVLDPQPQALRQVQAAIAAALATVIEWFG